MDRYYPRSRSQVNEVTIIAARPKNIRITIFLANICKRVFVMGSVSTEKLGYVILILGPRLKSIAASKPTNIF
jgi:hypothetical protein